jgi:hypothetical protein
MIAIVNVSPEGTGQADNLYEIRIVGEDGYELICSFTHNRDDKLATCLGKASDAVSAARLEQVMKLFDKM